MRYKNWDMWRMLPIRGLNAAMPLYKRGDTCIWKGRTYVALSSILYQPIKAQDFTDLPNYEWYGIKGQIHIWNSWHRMELGSIIIMELSNMITYQLVSFVYRSGEQAMKSLPNIRRELCMHSLVIT